MNIENISVICTECNEPVRVKGLICGMVDVGCACAGSSVRYNPNGRWVKMPTKEVNNERPIL